MGPVASYGVDSFPSCWWCPALHSASDVADTRSRTTLDVAFVRTTDAAWEPRTPCWNLFLSPFPSICCLSCWKSLISSRWWCRWFFRWPLRSLALEHAFHSSKDHLERLIRIKLNCGRVLCLMIYRISCYPCLCRIFLSTLIWCDSRLPKHQYHHNRAARKISKCITLHRSHRRREITFSTCG